MLEDYGLSLPLLILRGRGLLDAIRQLGRLLGTTIHLHLMRITDHYSFQTHDSYLSASGLTTCFCCTRRREASCPIYSTPSSTDHYLCAEATTSVCSIGYAFESSFSEAHRRWITDSISIQAFTPTHTTSLQDGLTLFLPSGTRA